MKKSALPVLSLVTLINLVALKSADCAGTPVSRTKADTAMVAPISSLVAVSKNGAADKESDQFDFGDVSPVDDRLIEGNILSQVTGQDLLPGIKHTFYIKNVADKPVTLTEVETSCPSCLRAQLGEVRGGEHFPYVIQPGQVVPINIGFKYRNVDPGRVQLEVDLKTNLPNTLPLVLKVRGNIQSAISLPKDGGRFGDITFGTGKTKEISVTVDRRVPRYMVPGAPLHVISTNRYVHVVSGVATPPVQGIKISKDYIIIDPTVVGDLPADLTAIFKIEVDANAPVGPVGGEIKVIIDGAPIYALTQSARTQINASVLGHLDVAGPRLFVFGRVPSGVVVTRSVQIGCSDPIEAKDLRISSTVKSLSVSLDIPKDMQPPADPNETAEPATAQHAMQGAMLTVSTKPDSPLGEMQGSIIVSNVKNKEYVELYVLGEVTDNKRVPQRQNGK